MPPIRCSINVILAFIAISLNADAGFSRLNWNLLNWPSGIKIMDPISPSWAKSDGQDLLLVTKINQFKSSIEGLFAVVSDKEIHSIEFESLLGFEKLGDGRHSKLKISHPKGDLESSAELVILDGPSAFSIKEHIPLMNDLLIVLDSLEFTENELAFVNELELVAESDDLKEDEFHTTAEKFPVGFEVSSYTFSR